MLMFYYFVVTVLFCINWWWRILQWFRCGCNKVIFDCVKRTIFFIFSQVIMETYWFLSS